jgi:hypothetical protein
MPVVPVLDSFLKTIILVENYRLRFKISGSGPAGTLDTPLSTRFERFIRFWTDTLCPPCVTVGHAVALVATLCHTCVDVCCVLLCTVCLYVLCTCVWVCAMLCCVVLICCVSVCFYWSVCVILVIFLVFRRMTRIKWAFSKPPFS